MLRILKIIIKIGYVAVIAPVGLMLLFFVVMFPMPGVTSDEHLLAWYPFWTALVVMTLLVFGFKHLIKHLTKVL